MIILLRESLGYARVAKEAIRIIKEGKVRIDGVVRKDHRFPVGLMDVVQIQGIGQVYRMLPKPNKGLSPSPIQEKEAGYKLCKVTGKRNVIGGKTQLNLHDGRSIIVQPRDPRQKQGEEFSVGGALQLGVPDQKLMRYVPFQTGAQGLVVDGRNQGLHGKITSLTQGTQARPAMVKIQTSAEEFETPAKYVIPVGTEAPLVQLES